MIGAWLTAARLWVVALPDGLRRILMWAIIALAAALLLMWWLARHDARVIERHEAETKAEVSAKASQGAAAGHEVATQTKDRIEQENDDARAAADGSDDPLADALRRLRREGQD